MSTGKRFGRRRRLTALAIGAAIAGAAATTAHAELIYGVAHTGGQNTLNKLFTFDSATPGSVNDLGNISGLGPFQYLDDIDFNPATGVLYGLGYTGSIYTINTTTLVATAIGSVPAPGSGFSGAGIDFDPVTGRLRIVDGGSLMNYSYNVNNNTFTLDSPLLQYVAGDPNLVPTPPFPRVQGIAYDNNVAGALTTTLFGLDVHGPVAPPATTLVTINPANGDMTTVGSTGVVAGDQEGFDISGATGSAYAVLKAQGPGQTPMFYTINTATGQATLVGGVDLDTDFLLRGIWVAPDGFGPGGGPNGVPLPAAVVVGPIGAMLAGVVARRYRRRHD